MTPLHLNVTGQVERFCEPFGRVSVVGIAGLMSFVLGIQCAAGRDFPLAPIVGGHRLQPHENELQALHSPDVTAPEAAEIDRLYQKLIQCPGPQCTTKN